MELSANVNYFGFLGYLPCNLKSYVSGISASASTCTIAEASLEASAACRSAEMSNGMVA